MVVQDATGGERFPLVLPTCLSLIKTPLPLTLLSAWLFPSHPVPTSTRCRTPSGDLPAVPLPLSSPPLPHLSLAHSFYHTHAFSPTPSFFNALRLFLSSSYSLSLSFPFPPVCVSVLGQGVFYSPPPISGPLESNLKGVPPCHTSSPTL